MHVGLQKTGSTWLQEGYFKVHPELDMYGSLSKVPKHVNNYIATFYNIEYDKEKWVSGLEALIKPDHSKVVGFTNEQFSGHLWSMHQGIELASRIKSTFGDIKIILVLRDPITFIQSGYIQSIRSGTETRSLEKVLSNNKTRQDIIHRITYKNLINAYHQHFSEVLILPYELLRKDQKSFLTRINKFLNVSDIDISSINTTQNKGISALAQKFMQAANFIDQIVFPKKRIINKVFRKIIRKIPTSLPKMKPITKEFLLQYEGFEQVLNATNYTIWNDDLSEFNYLKND